MSRCRAPIGLRNNIVAKVAHVMLSSQIVSVVSPDPQQQQVSETRPKGAKRRNPGTPAILKHRLNLPCTITPCLINWSGPSEGSHWDRHCIMSCYLVLFSSLVVVDSRPLEHKSKVYVLCILSTYPCQWYGFTFKRHSCLVLEPGDEYPDVILRIHARLPDLDKCQRQTFSTSTLRWIFRAGHIPHHLRGDFQKSGSMGWIIK